MSEVLPDPRWYAVRTRSRHEKRVRDELGGRPSVEVFLPLYHRLSWWGDRMKQVDAPLFRATASRSFAMRIVSSSSRPLA